MLDDDFEDFDQPSFDVDETFTIPCQNCGTDVYEDATACPVCGEYVVRSTRALDGKPTWFIWLGLIGIIAVIFALLFI